MNTEINISSNHPGGTVMLAGHQVARIGFGAMQLPGPLPGDRPATEMQL